MVFNTDYHLMQDKSIAEFSKGCILQYVIPTLSYQLSFSPLFCLFLSDRFNVGVRGKPSDQHSIPRKVGLQMRVRFVKLFSLFLI